MQQENARFRTEEECVKTLKRNGVRINEVYSKSYMGDGPAPVIRRDIVPSVAMGLKLIRVVDCLLHYFPKRKYHYSYSATR